ncbi:diaminopimelate epimerase [Butyricicoccus sp.]|uniref:diaminopimelate epimerase n=1 Tax=Butyricicoccus sp. TaxID=2049021 RepID=UPI003D7EB171
MKLKFTKMHGCGNDYIYFNCFEQEVADPEALSIRLSDRHFGIGGDGIVLICPSDVADAKMRMFNADGSEGKMCGNATRCIGKYMYEHGLISKPEMTLETLSGIKILKMTEEDGKITSVRVDMGKAILKPSEIPTKYTGDTAVSVPLTVDGTEYAVTCVSMGNPHCIVFVDQDVNTLDLPKIGPSFENHEMFPERINTEFIRVIDDHTLQMRVWERGSGETLACGTGACAAAVASVLNGYCPKGEDITIHLIGGDLKIRYTDEAVYLTGPATTVFEGSIEL